ncbi:hypothetical protein BGZ60DRAFT_164137 [Tricladium varicosporioides]|nr:hypothetical protein BGZ60DRAFT_164137 [Hymenoscyphus varicosporioides]
MPTVVVLLGMGGCGKSQLALEYCQQSENDGSFSVIFWIDAISPSTIDQSFNGLAQELSKPRFDAADVEGNARYVLTTISARQVPWLLVFDNFDNPHSFRNRSIKEYFPRSNKASILVTSRDEEAKTLGYHIDVSIMSNEEAPKLLFRRSSATRSNVNILEADRIVKRLGFHALAIDQAGAYILARSLDFDLFLEHYDERMKEVLNEAPGLWDYQRKLNPNQEIMTKLTVFTTWELSFNMITRDQKIRDDKEHLLTLIAFFDRNQISDALFKPYSSQKSSWMTSCTKDGAWDKYRFQDIVKDLRNLSLIQSLKIQRSGALFSLHPLVQDWIKLRISSKSRRAYTIEATLVLSSFIKTQLFHEMTFNARQMTLSHLEAVFRNDQEYLSQQDRLQDITMLDATFQFIDFLTNLSQYKAAEELCRRELEGREGLLGKEHPYTLRSMNTLACLLHSQGKHDKAEPICRQTLTLAEKVLGKEHPDTLICMNNLASLLHSQGKYDKAEPICRQTLALAEKVLGKEHPDTLTCMHNLASLLLSQGKYDKAESICRQTLALSKKVLGEEYPDTLRSMHNLARLLQSQGEYDKAEPICRQTLALKERVLGEEHPDTLVSMHNLSRLLHSQGKYDKAESICRQTLTLSKKVLGEEHPDTLRSMNNLTLLLQSQGKYDEAELINRQMLALGEKVLGKEHPYMLGSMNNLAGLLQSQGKYDEAEPIYRQTLTLREKVLGK